LIFNRDQAANGRIENEAGGTFVTDGSGSFGRSSAGNVAFNNAGLFIKRNAANTFFDSNVPFNSNGGTVNIEAGTLDFQASGAYSGQFSPSAGGTLRFVSGTHSLNSGASFAGLGTVRFQAPVQLGAAVNLSNVNAVFESSASVSGSFTISNSPGGTITVAKAMTFPGSIDAGGTFVLTSGSLVVSDSGTFTLQSSGTLNNPGTNFSVCSFVNNGGAIIGNPPVVTCPNQPPQIVMQPQSQRILVGSNVTFTVTAVGSLPLAYQWRFNGANLSGETSTSLTRVNAQVSDGGTYAVIVSNDVSVVSSSNALLAVKVGNLSPVAQMSDLRAVLALDGIDDAAQRDAVSKALDIGLLNWTVAAWIRPTNSAGDMFIASRYECGQGTCGASDGSAATLWYLYLSSQGHLGFELRDDPGVDRAVSGAADLRDGQWHYVAGVLDRQASEVRLLVDGAVTATTNATGFTLFSDPSSPFAIGRIFNNNHPSDQSFFHGNIYDVRVWNVARSAADLVAESAGPSHGDEPGLAGYWPLNEGFGSTAFDRTTNHNDLTLQGNPAWQALVVQTNTQDRVVQLQGFDPDDDPLLALVTTLPGSGAQLFQTPDGATRGAQITSVPALVNDASRRVILAPAPAVSTDYFFRYELNDGLVNSAETTAALAVSTPASQLLQITSIELSSGSAASNQGPEVTLSGRKVVLSCRAPAGQSFMVQGSADLTHWSDEAASITETQPGVCQATVQANSAAHRFYRLRLVDSR
jgi:hypothetical protein